MERNRLEVSSLFYKGMLFQIGDPILSKVESLTNIGFRRHDSGGTLKKILVYTDTLCNSSYLNHGFTYTTIGGLGYVFEFTNGKSEYAFESDMIKIPYKVGEQTEYITNYYLSEVNKDKLDNLIEYFKIPEKEIKRVGKYLRANHKEEYSYIVLCFKIRQGMYGKIEDVNQFSHLMFKVLGENGLTNVTTNKLHLFTSGNRPSSGNARYKSI